MMGRGRSFSGVGTRREGGCLFRMEDGDYRNGGDLVCYDHFFVQWNGSICGGEAGGIGIS